MNAFQINRALINPKFEGYKLDLASDDAVKRYPLAFKPTQSTHSGRIPLSFQEVRSRITHNHLAVADGDSRALYIDAEFKVIVVTIDNSLEPLFHVAYELPQPVQSSALEASLIRSQEYPSAFFLDPQTAFVADGRGSLYILSILEGTNATLIGEFKLVPPTGEGEAGLPFRIHSVAQVNPERAIAVLSSRRYSDPLKPSHANVSPHERNPTPIEFDIYVIKFETPFASCSQAVPSGHIQKLDILWHGRGGDVPISATYVESQRCVLLACGSVFRPVGADSPQTYEPNEDEIAPVPRINENLDSEMREKPPAPPPYSWTQTPDSITVAFPLPSSTAKTNIKVSFSNKALSLRIEGPAARELESVPIPRYLTKPLWDAILPSTSFWTWDKEGEKLFGILTLHIDKANEGTKWVQLFQSTARKTGVAKSEQMEDEEVPETLDPSELWHIREALEKYTSELAGGGTGKDARSIPSLAANEADEELDSSVGREVYATWVPVLAESEETPEWLEKAEEIPFTLLSTALPGLGNGFNGGVSFLVKNNVDGTVHQLASSHANGDGARGPPIWQHTLTFSALAFVLASKQDTRFTHHVLIPATPESKSAVDSPRSAVLAFDNGARGGAAGGGGNVYIYRGPTKIKDPHAKQCIINIGDGQSGSLLGVGATVASIKTDEDVNSKGKLNIAVLCLCETQLVVLGNVL